MAANAIKAGEAYLTLAVRDANFRSSVNRSLGRLAGLGRSLRSIGSLGFGGLTGFQRLLFSIAGSAALAWPVKLAADLELATAQFTALTGSADKAKAILDELQLFAPVASQTFEQLQHAARALLNYGLAADQVVPVVKSLAAVSGGNADAMDRLSIAFGQVAAKGKLAAEEVRQMVNAGFSPLQEISRTTGRSFRQVVSDMEAGAIGVDQVVNAFKTATSEGGRFGGLLRAMANTTKGQFAILKTSIAIAVRPLGEELLPAFTGLLRRVNDLMPGFAAFVKENAGFARVVAVVVASGAALLGVLFSVGVAIQVLAFGLAGLATAFGLVLNPIGLVIGGLALALAALIRFTSTGQAVSLFLANRFVALLEVASQTFGGIADALIAGDIQAAANVFWAGLRLTWLQGTRELTESWEAFKDVFLRTTLEMVFSAQSYWVSFSQALRTIWNELVTQARITGEDIGHWLSRSSDPATAADQDSAHEVAKNQIRAEGDARRNEIEQNKRAELAANEANRAAAAEDRKRQFEGANIAAQQAREQARKELDAARNAAALAAANLPGGLKDKFGGLLAGAGGGVPDFKSRAIFGGRLAAQTFGDSGGADPIPRQQLIEIRKAARALERIERRRGFEMRVGRA